MNNFNDCYKYLEINYDTPFEDIHKKYKAKAKELHPDLNPDIDTTEQFQKLNNCFNYIKNNYSKYKGNDEEIEFEDGFKIVVSFGDEEVNIHKYKKDLSMLSCGCPDWFKRRKNFSIKDPRRLCKHLIASFEKKDSVLNIESSDDELLLKNYQSMIKIPNSLLQYSNAIYRSFNSNSGFDLYWHNDRYETDNVIIYYIIKSKGTSAAIIYLKKYDFEVSCELTHYYDLEGHYITYDNVLFNSVGLGIFIKFCNQSILNDIKIFVSRYDQFTIAFNRLLDYYNNDYCKFGRKFLKNAEELTKPFESNHYYADNLYQLSDTHYFSLSYFISEELYKIQKQKMSKYNELKNILKTNPHYKLDTRKMNIILNKMGVIKKDKELNNNNWIIVNAYEKFGINFIEYANKENEKQPSWYSVHYYNTYNFQIEKYNKGWYYTKILFEKNSFEELYQMCLDFQEIEENKQLNNQTTNKPTSNKKLEREKWLRHVNCPNCAEKTNIHKKDKRKRTAGYTVQRFYCNECNSMFQMDLGELEKLIQEYEGNKIKKDKFTALEETVEVQLVAKEEIQTVETQESEEKESNIFKKLFSFFK